MSTTSVWDGARFVAIDTETTGLHDTARILAVALYCMENGATVESWCTLMNPGVFAATEIQLLDPKKLARAKPFAVHADHLRELLSVESGTVYLVAHNFTYDAARLAYEYSLLGHHMRLSCYSTQARSHVQRVWSFRAATWTLSPRHSC
ncbi:MAG: 3'-5' exonuclease [Ilumatobacteraceae bacterium]|nr:3'-5' exonuclease [Ilumatobacteraceae bacterium]